MSTMEIIKEVRNRSHASLKDCASAVDEAGGDVDKALRILQERGVIKGAGRSKVASEGRVQTYLHGEGRISVVVEINCETDFAARSQDFKEFCEMVSMHIAGMNPQFTHVGAIPASTLAEQKAIFRRQVEDGKKPEHVVDKIVSGKLDRWLDETVLTCQKAVLSSTPDKTIDEVRALLSSKLGETVSIRRFTRWEVGEGIEKAQATNYAVEVAMLAAG